jgi:hypothetical protein
MWEVLSPLTEIAVMESGKPEFTALFQLRSIQKLILAVCITVDFWSVEYFSRHLLSLSTEAFLSKLVNVALFIYFRFQSHRQSLE